LPVFDLVPGLNENFDYLTLVNSFSKVGKFELYGHMILQS
jgi:hypothetical protein